MCGIFYSFFILFGFWLFGLMVALSMRSLGRYDVSGGKCNDKKYMIFVLLVCFDRDIPCDYIVLYMFWWNRIYYSLRCGVRRHIRDKIYRLMPHNHVFTYYMVFSPKKSSFDFYSSSVYVPNGPDKIFKRSPTTTYSHTEENVNVWIYYVYTFSAGYMYKMYSIRFLSDQQ